jgi:thiol-disulfide isomerase/thioredoxin
MSYYNRRQAYDEYDNSDSDYDDVYYDNGYDSIGRDEDESEEVAEWAKGKPVAFFVKFASWCHYCHDLLKMLGLPYDPENPKPVHTGDPNVYFAEQKTLQPSADPQSYPTVLKFVNGKQVPKEQSKHNREELLEYFLGPDWHSHME